MNVALFLEIKNEYKDVYDMEVFCGYVSLWRMGFMIESLKEIDDVMDEFIEDIRTDQPADTNFKSDFCLGWGPFIDHNYIYLFHRDLREGECRIEITEINRHVICNMLLSEFKKFKGI